MKKIVRNVGDRSAAGEFDPQFVIPGNPLSWRRPGRSGSRIYDTQKQEKIVWGIYLQKQMTEKQFITKLGPLCFECIFWMQAPLKLNRKKQNELDNSLHWIKPDTDNLLKFVLDVCKDNGLFHDDAQVSIIKAVKLYSTEYPRTEFSLYELDRQFISCDIPQ